MQTDSSRSFQQKLTSAVCVWVCVREREWVCVCVCVRERERERESVCVCVWERHLHYIYIYAFSRRFYPKRLILHSSYSFTFDQLLLSLGIEPMILALLAPCSTIWATGKRQRERVCVCVCVLESERACVCVCERVRVCVSVSVFRCVLDFIKRFQLLIHFYVYQ